MPENGKIMRYPPERSLKVLKNIFKSSEDSPKVEKIAEELDINKGTLYNYLKDLKTIGFVETENRKVKLIKTDAPGKIFQLDDLSPLKEEFLNIDYTEELIEEVDEDGVSVTSLGKKIAYKAETSAVDDETFKNYGSNFAKWCDYLNLATYDSRDGKLYTSSYSIVAEDQEKGGMLRATVKETFEILRELTKSPESLGEIADNLSVSKRTVGRRLSTAYSLGLASYTGNIYELTEAGKKLLSKSVGNNKAYIRKKLLELPIFKAYVFYITEVGTSNEAIVKISERYSRGWKEGYIKTIAKRLKNWGKYAEIIEDRGGKIQITENVEKS